MKEVISVEVEKSGYEVMQAVAKLITAVKAAHVAGGNLAVEIPADVSAALVTLAPVVGQVPQIPADAVEDREAMLKGVLISGVDIAKAISG